MRISLETSDFLTSSNLKKKFVDVSSFIKDEVYPCYKYPRPINSRSDHFKVRTGPIFKLIEEKLFALKYFIKHTPADERSKEIRDKLYQEMANIVGTDYTSFEALFVKEIMEACEMQLYEYMTQNLPDKDWYKLVHDVLVGNNVCHFDGFDMRVEATRMSGEMCTSLGNSFTNLMVFLFITKELGCRKVKGRVEGDDGIFSFFGPIPTPADFASLGLIIKMEVYDKITEGSFCGIIADEDELINIRDPIDVLINFGWTTRQYAKAHHKKKMELLRAKSLSLLYQYAGCPILDALARYGLRMTEGYHFKLSCTMSTYEKEKFIRMHNKFKDELPYRVTGMKTRMLMEKKFGVTVTEQLLLEDYLNNLDELKPLDHPVILTYCHKDAVDYVDRFTVPLSDETDAFGMMYHRAEYLSAYSQFYVKTTTSKSKPPKQAC